MHIHPITRTLQEVLHILGDTFPFEVVSARVDLPELQGEPDEVSAEKCKLAAGAFPAGEGVVRMPGC